MAEDAEAVPSGFQPSLEPLDPRLGRISLVLTGAAVLFFTADMVLYFSFGTTRRRPLTIVQVGHGLEILLWWSLGAAMAAARIGKKTPLARQAWICSLSFAALLAVLFAYGCYLAQARRARRPAVGIFSISSAPVANGRK